LGRLHGLVDHRQQLSREGVEVDLVAQAGPEPLDHPGRVMAAAGGGGVRPRAGWNSAATARVAPATTRGEFRPRSWPSPSTTRAEPPARRRVSRPEATPRARAQ